VEVGAVLAVVAMAFGDEGALSLCNVGAAKEAGDVIGT
jgi:hypothetical protein